MTEAAAPRVELLGVSKVFPGVQALDNVDFHLNGGEVHALLGENGAGKSTLIKIMTGAAQRDSGKILFDGAPVEIATPAEARALGISTVYQEVNLIPTMSVTKNLTLERQPRRYGLISWRQASARARERLKRLRLDIDVERPLASYSIAVQQLVAIARALEDDTRVLVLDEPTASLDAREVDLLFGILRDLKTRGIAIVFITHFIDQVYQIADRISVLRNGRLVGTATTAELPRLDLISLMLGRALEQTERRRATGAPAPMGEPILAVEGLGRRRTWAILICSSAPERWSGLPACSDRGGRRRASWCSARCAMTPARFASKALRSRSAHHGRRCDWASAFAPRIARPKGSFPS